MGALGHEICPWHLFLEGCLLVGEMLTHEVELDAFQAADRRSRSYLVCLAQGHPAGECQRWMQKLDSYYSLGQTISPASIHPCFVLSSFLCDL